MISSPPSAFFDTDETMSYGLSSTGVYLVLHGDSAPGNAEWERYVVDVEKHVRDLNAMVVFTVSGGPNALQRQQVSKMWERVGRVPPIVVMSASVVARVAVSALNMFLDEPIRMVAPDKLHDALHELGVPVGKHNAVRQDLIKMMRARGMPPPSTF